jgi:hypothetical protein
VIGTSKKIISVRPEPLSGERLKNCSMKFITGSFQFAFSKSSRLPASTNDYRGGGGAGSCGMQPSTCG